MSDAGQLQTSIQELKLRAQALLELVAGQDYPADGPPSGALDRAARQGQMLELSTGLEQLLRALSSLMAALPQQPHDEDLTRQRVLLQGLSAVLDYFEPQPLVMPALPPALPPQAPGQTSSGLATPSSGVPGLAQFIDAFRREAAKRLSGLSISLMGMFNERHGTKSLDASAQHLHAVRGSAAMLNLKPFAEIAGLMEQLIVTMRRVPVEQRVWPTKAIMRGYNALELALRDPHLELDPHEAAQVCQALRECFDELAIETTLEELSSTAHDVSAAARQASTTSSTTPPSPRLAHASAQGSPSPQRSSPSAAQAHVQAQAAPPPPMEQRILIVDDVETIAASVGFVLSELDVPIDIATHGEEALRMINANAYSLVVSDIAMPRMDGIALTRLIRQSPRHHNVPIILLTALDHPSERDAGIDAGANDYIIKGSIGGGELIYRVRELLKIAPFVPVRSARKVVDRRRILVTDDAETVAASVAFVLSQGDFDIVLASDGMEALTLLEREPFDLLMSDWQMPNMSGIELVQAVRASTMVRPLPIVLLTSLDTEDARQRALRAGADAFLVKGTIAGAPLLELVERLMRQYHTMKA